MSRPCSICRNSDSQRTAAAMLAEGATDQAVATRLGVGRMAVARHRVNHILTPTKHQLEILGKGAAPRGERQQLAAAAASDAPSAMDRVNALFGAGASAERLLAVAERLERLAVAAEAAGSSNAVAQLAAQQLRGVEVGARLAGAGGYAPGKGPGEGASPGAQFSVNIHIGGERVVSVRAALDGQHVETAAD